MGLYGFSSQLNEGPLSLRECPMLDSQLPAPIADV